MLEMGYPALIMHMLITLYRKVKARIKVAGTISGEFRDGRGVRQGCVGLLSPSMFNFLTEMVVRVALDGFEGGLQLGGRRVTNLRYVDDIVLTACSALELQTLVDRLKRRVTL